MSTKIKHLYNIKCTCDKEIKTNRRLYLQGLTVKCSYTVNDQKEQNANSVSNIKKTKDILMIRLSKCCC